MFNLGGTVHNQKSGGRQIILSSIWKIYPEPYRQIDNRLFTLEKTDDAVLLKIKSNFHKFNPLINK